MISLKFRSSISPASSLQPFQSDLKFQWIRNQLASFTNKEAAGIRGQKRLAQAALKKTQEKAMNTTIAAAIKISMDATLVVFFFLSQLDSIFTFEEEQKATLKAFS